MIFIRKIIEIKHMDKRDKVGYYLKVGRVVEISREDAKTNQDTYTFLSRVVR